MASKDQSNARISRVKPGEVKDPELDEVFQDFLDERGAVPNMFRIFAHRPKMMITAFEHFRAVTYEGELDLLTKELIAVAVSEINNCGYCLGSHRMLAKRHGASDEDLSNLESLNYRFFDDATQVALEYARQFTEDATEIDDGLWDRLTTHYTEGEIIEITAMAGVFNYFNRFNVALKTPLTDYPDD